MNRRSILRMFAAAPVAAAAPVMARAETQSAGVSIFGNAAYGSLVAGVNPSDTYNHANWLKERLQEVFSGKVERDIRADVMSNPVRALDPDLASSRAFSLSAAIRMQRERDIVRRLEQARSSWLHQFKTETGMDWVP